MVKELYTTSELAQFLKVHEKTVYNLRLEGMPCIMIGRAVRFKPDEVIKWIESREQNA